MSGRTATQPKAMSCRGQAAGLNSMGCLFAVCCLAFHGGRRKEKVMSELTRRQFLKVTGMSLVGSSLAMMGFSPGPALAEVREYKLTRASESRLKYPEYRAPGSDRWQRMSWDDALDRIAKLMKQDRDANFVAKTPDGLTVNRWLTTGMLAASASSNEVGYLTHKVARSLGLLAFDNQARV